MKKVLILIAMVFFATAARAKVCELDWLATITKAPSTTSETTYTPTDISSDTYKKGSWAVFLIEGRTINGLSFCGNSTSARTKSSTETDNKNCWCRTVSPKIGSDWILTNHSAPPYITSSYCNTNCAFNCLSCVMNGSFGSSCTTTALFAH